MKTRIWLTGGLCAAAVMLAGMSTAAVLAEDAEAQAGAAVLHTQIEQADDESRAGKYIVADLAGRIGVYYMDQLIYTADIETAGLRALDRELLARGIETSSYEDVLRLLEDFGS